VNFFIFLILLQIASAQETDLFFKDVLPGGYAHDVIQLAPTGQLFNLRLSVQGDIKQWVSISEYESRIDGSKPLEINVVVEPPDDVEEGTYTGIIIFDYYSGGTGITTTVPVKRAVKVIVKVTKEEKRKGKINWVEISDAEQGQPFAVKSMISNKGNIEEEINIEARLYDGNQTVGKASQRVQILPTDAEEITLSLPSEELTPGKYEIEVGIEFVDEKQTIRKNVQLLEKGTFLQDVQIVQIEISRKAAVNTTIPFVAAVKSDGQKIIPLQVRIEIVRDGQVIESLESETIVLEEGKEKKIPFEFTPTIAGVYIVRAVVLVNNQQSAAMISSVEVVEDVVIVPLSIGFMLVVIIFAFAYFLRQHLKQRFKSRMKKRKQRGVKK